MEPKMLLTLVLCCTPAIIRAFSITTITASSGEEPTQPAFSGSNANAIELRCRMQLNAGERWTKCEWIHNLRDTWGLNNQQGYIFCSIGDTEKHETECQDAGNMVDNRYGNSDSWTKEYARRLKYLATEDECGIRITNPHANDTGTWKCIVDDNNPNGQSGSFWKEIELFVANRSEVKISNPVQQSVKVDLSSGSGSIQAACKSMYGYPPPTMRWYIDDINNEVTRDGDVQNNIVQDSMVSTFRLNLDENKLSKYKVKIDHGTFSFALGCYPYQGDYFPENSGNYVRNPAEVMVFGTSSASCLHLSLLTVLLLSVCTYLY